MARKQNLGGAPTGVVDAHLGELTGEPVEVDDLPVEVVTRAAAIDVAQDSGMVCTRVSHESRAGRRMQRVWPVSARYGAVTALMSELAAAGVQRLVLESTSDYWRSGTSRCSERDNDPDPTAALLEVSAAELGGHLGALAAAARTAGPSSTAALAARFAARAAELPTGARGRLSVAAPRCGRAGAGRAGSRPVRLPGVRAAAAARLSRRNCTLRYNPCPAGRVSELTVSEVREHLADAIDQARSEPVYLSRRGRRVAVLLDAALYEHLLEQLEDAEDAQAADQARAELAAGAEPIPWEHVKADLGIDV